MNPNSYVCEFDLYSVVMLRPSCETCNRSIQSGYSYVHPDPRTGYPIMTFWCHEDAPDWVRKAAKKSLSTIPPGGDPVICKKEAA